MTETTYVEFPPPVGVGKRVSEVGGKIGGVVVSEIRDCAFYTGYGSYRFHVQWDDATESTHYPNNLIGIGDFKTLDDLTKTLRPIAVHVYAGPMGGFRAAALELELNGEYVMVGIDSRNWWNILRPIIDSTPDCLLTEQREERKRRA